MVNVPRGARRQRIQPTTVTTKSTPMTIASTGEDAAPRRAARPKIAARKPAMTLTSRRRSSMRVAPSGVGTIELRYESFHVLGDFVARRAHFVERAPLRIGQVPVDVALAGEIGAGVTAPHRHEHVG